MKNTAPRLWITSITFGCALLLSPYRATGQGSAGAEVLTNESVVQMVVGKVPKDVILTKIQSTSTAFDITANGLVSLHQRKVPANMIKAMVQASNNATNKEVLTNTAVVYMVTNGLPRDIIVAKIQSAKPGYDLTADGLVSLNLSKVPQPVQKAMMASAASTPATPAAPPPAVSPAQSTAAPAPAPPAPAPRAVSPPSSTGQPAGARGAGRGAGNQVQDAKSPPADTKK